MEEFEIKKKKSEGWIQAIVVVEIVGKPKKHVEDTIKDYIKQMGQNKNVSIQKKKINKAKKHEKEFFVTFAELEMLFKNLSEMIYFCFDYMPSSIDIIEPEQMVYKSREMTSFINDLQARLHNVDMLVKTTKQHNINLNENFTKILKNFIAQSCVIPKSPEELEKIIGMEKKHLEKVIMILEKEKRIQKQGEKYKTIK